MASRKLNRVATSRSRLRNRPAEIVPPERDTPGMRARHCAKPMTMASRMVSSSKERLRFENFSAAMNTKENSTSTVAVIHRLRSPSRMRSLPKKPMIAIGSVPTMTIQPMR